MRKGCEVKEFFPLLSEHKGSSHQPTVYVLKSTFKLPQVFHSCVAFLFGAHISRAAFLSSLLPPLLRLEFFLPRRPCDEIANQGRTHFITL